MRRAVRHGAMTPGRRQLLAALQRTSQTEVALRCDVTQVAVSYWASGQKRPSEESQRMLAEHCFIDGAWDVEAREEKTPWEIA